MSGTSALHPGPMRPRFAHLMEPIAGDGSLRPQGTPARTAPAGKPGSLQHRLNPVRGNLTIRMRAPEQPAESAVSLAPGQAFVVPRGIEHCPVATEETWMLMFEPSATRNTGDHGGERTTDPDDLR